MQKTLMAAMAAAAVLSACGSNTSGEAQKAQERDSSEPGWAIGTSPPRIPGQPAYAVIIKVGEQRVLQGEEARRVYGDQRRHDSRPIEIFSTGSAARGAIELACSTNIAKNDVQDVKGRTPKPVIDMAVAMNRAGMCFPSATPIATTTYGQARDAARKIAAR